MFTRRQFVGTGAMAGAGLLLPWRGSIRSANAASDWQVNPLNPSNLTKYKDALLSEIPVLEPEWNKYPGFAFYKLGMAQGTHRFHSDMPGADTPTFGYGGFGYLGPTIESRTGQKVAVLWKNNLPDTHILGVDDALVPPDAQGIGGRAVVHLHGGHGPYLFDGGPEHWFAPGKSRLYYYPNIQDAASLWYHDHAVGITRLNVYAGLAGLYLIRDCVEDDLNLPGGNSDRKLRKSNPAAGPYEIPLILQDKQFDADGQLLYPFPWEAEFFGDTILANGTIWPYLQVEPRKYRFRIYNGSNARFFRLRISSAAPGPGHAPNSVLPFNQIGAEGGFLPVTVQLGELLMGNGERADVIVDFSNMKGKTLYLTNDAAAPFSPAEPPLDPGTDGDVMQVMQFKVTKKLGGTDKSTLPSKPRSISSIPLSSVAQTRNLTLVEADDENHPEFSKVLINNRLFMVGDGVITETPKLGSAEIWNFINMTPDTHPMHLHLVHFQVLDRQPFDVAAYQAAYGLEPAPVGANLFTTGSRIPRAANERGLKDTFKANPGEITRIIARFTDFTGKFVYHCHILDHEENDMMQYMEVKP